jgi:hypothetical protein
VLVGAAAGRWAPTGADAAGAAVAGFDTVEPALSRAGFVPGVVFSGFVKLFAVGLDGCWEFPVATGLFAASLLGLFGAGALGVELIGAGAGDLIGGAAGFLVCPAAGAPSFSFGL